MKIIQTIKFKSVEVNRNNLYYSKAKMGFKMINESNNVNEYILDVLGKSIGIVSNTKDTEKIVLHTRQWFNEDLDYEIFLLKSDIINTSFVKDSSFITIANIIDEIVDEEICVNSKYKMFSWNIKEYTFPGSCMIVSEDNKRKSFIICSQLDILMFYFKKVVKDIIFDIYREQGYEKIHASGVEKEGKALLFVGDGFSGKTTTAVKLTEKGYSILNDDMLFLRIKDNKLCVVGAPICCSLRDSARPYVNIKLDNDKMYSSKYQETSYYYGLPFVEKEIVVNTIIFLGYFEEPQMIDCYEKATDVIQVQIIKDYLTKYGSELNLWKSNKDHAMSIIDDYLI